jgi:sugar-specific transcriptional regulator TrmB
MRIRVEGLRAPSLRQDEGGETLGSGGRAAEQVYNTIQVLSTKGLVETTSLDPLEVRAKTFVRLANGYMNDRKCSLYEIQEKIDNYREATKNNKLVRVVV